MKDRNHVTRKARPPWLALVVYLAGPGGALAELPPIYAACANPKMPADEKIAACSSIILSGRDSGHNLAVSFANRGTAFGMKGDNDRAIADFDQAIRLDPGFARAYNNRSMAYRSKGDFARALADASAAIRLDAGYAAAWGTRGIAFLKKGDVNRALADLDRAIELDPRLAAAYDSRGSAYTKKGEIDRAMADFDQASRLDPKMASPYFNRGLIYSKRGQYDRALSEYDQALRVKPGFAQALNNRAWTHRLLGALDRALQDADAAIRLDPKYGIAFGTRGHIRLDRKEYDRAVADFSKAIYLDPTRASFFTGRGLAYEGKGDRQRAIADFNAALALPAKDDVDTKTQATARTRLAALAEASRETISRPAGQSAEALRPEPQPPTPPKIVRQPVQLAPVPARLKPLPEAIATCDTEAGDVQQLTLPGDKEDIRLDGCYRGRNHLTCVLGVLRQEAEALNREYQDIVGPNYPDVKDAGSVCQIEPDKLGAQIEKSKRFDERSAILKSAYAKTANCIDLVDHSLHEVVPHGLASGSELIKSMVEEIRNDGRSVASDQKKVLDLADKIEKSRRAMATIEQIGRGLCPRKSARK